MNDRQLLELAAKAGGIEVWPGIGFQAHMLFTRPAKADPDGKVTGVEWNPLDDDGAALRLAADLDLFGDPSYWHWLAIARLSNSTDKHANVRRAIVRAAAAIGKEM
ncbi:hypothetical protein ACOTF2_06975 [Achromobacter xylosoxidans]|uniref:hypothetical protein n=1 Tax=Alcaligenes xylosoxydans xylosoxydans TaxID=85698 RepID=UPI0038FCE0DC